MKGNFVAHHMHKSCRPSIVPSKRLYNRRQEGSSRVGWVELENDSEGCFMQGEEGFELMLDSGCGEGVLFPSEIAYLTETDKLEE